MSVRHVIRLNIDRFCTFEVLPEVTNILVTRDNMLHRKRIYLQKNERSIIKHNVRVFPKASLTANPTLILLKVSWNHCDLPWWIVWITEEHCGCKTQKQPPRGVFKKRSSENIQQIYRTAMPKCDLKLKLKSHFGMGVLL